MNAWSAVVDAAFDLFDRVTLDPAPPSHEDGGESAASVVRSSIEDPIGDVALSRRLKSPRRITIVVSDGPASVSESALQVLVDHLDAFASEDAEIIALVATDWRTPPSPDALAELPHVRLLMQHQIPVVVHDRREARPVGVVTVGDQPVPVELNPLVLDVDLVLLPGAVELAWGAGLSGGYEAIARGVAGAGTLAALDRLADQVDDEDRTKIDRAHPLHEAWARVAAAAAPAFAMFETVTATSRAFVSGEPSMALAVLAERPGSPWYTDAEVFDGLVVHVPLIGNMTCLDGFAEAMVVLEHRRAPLAKGAPVLVVFDSAGGWAEDAAHDAFTRALTTDDWSAVGQGDGVIAARTLARRLAAASRRHPVHVVLPADAPRLGEDVQRHRDVRDGCDALAMHMRALADDDETPHAAIVRDITVRLPVRPSKGRLTRRRSSG